MGVLAKGGARVKSGNMANSRDFNPAEVKAMKEKREDMSLDNRQGRSGGPGKAL